MKQDRSLVDIHFNTSDRPVLVAHDRFADLDNGINARESSVQSVELHTGIMDGISKGNIDGISEATAQARTPDLADKWLAFWQANFHGKLLLVLICVLLACASIAGTRVGLVTLDALWFLISFLTATVFLHQNKKAFWAYTGCAMIMSMLDAVSQFAPNTVIFGLLGTVCGVGFAVQLIAAIIFLIIKLSRVRRVTIDTIFGGICVYMLLAFLWYVFYAVILVYDPTAFKFAYTRTGAYDLMYFSLNTISTLGQGDIVPLSRLTMVLCNLEAIVGQIFPSVFIARLVSLYVINELEDRNSKRPSS